MHLVMMTTVAVIIMATRHGSHYDQSSQQPYISCIIIKNANSEGGLQGSETGLPTLPCLACSATSTAAATAAEKLQSELRAAVVKSDHYNPDLSSAPSLATSYPSALSASLLLDPESTEKSFENAHAHLSMEQSPHLPK